MLKFSVYEGKSTGSVDDTFGARVVKDLSEKYFDLVRGSLEKKTSCCGTFRSDKKRYPRELLQSVEQMKGGDSDYASHGEISPTKWKDRGQKSLILLSAFHDPSRRVEIMRTNKTEQKEPLLCPPPVKDYNENMGGVDIIDQYISFHNISWESRRWWMEIFY
ncbi:hypothetical protein JTB14_023578 [Gonioctena quinquepunctata]|nr:hypothetical protein JTB14_023578 [Gonioctena quinquepunctata]